MKKLAVLILAISLLAGGGYYLYTWNKDKSGKSYETEEVRRGDLTSKVSATGKLGPKVSVLVGSEVSGTIRRIYVDNNSVVKKGQVLVRLDQEVINAQVEQARANVESAEARLRELESAREMNRSAVKTAIDETKSDAQKASADLERQKLLFNRGAIPRGDLDTAMNAEAVAMAKYRQALAAKGNYDVIEAQIDGAKAAVRQARAGLSTALTNLSKTVITAPMDGVVINRNVEAGQTVAASFSTPELLDIGDLSVMDVDVSIDEADVGSVAAGQAANFTVDAFPGRVFTGTLSKVYYAPVEVQNVVTYTGVVEVKNPDRALRPGMTANVEIVTSRKKDVLMAPNAALRVRMDPQEAKKIKPPEGKRTVWVMEGGKPGPVLIETGITDYVNTEVVSGLSEGDKVVVDVLGSDEKQSGNQPPRRSMRMFH